MDTAQAGSASWQSRDSSVSVMMGTVTSHVTSEARGMKLQKRPWEIWKRSHQSEIDELNHIKGCMSHHSTAGRSELVHDG